MMMCENQRKLFTMDFLSVTSKFTTFILMLLIFIIDQGMMLHHISRQEWLAEHPLPIAARHQHSSFDENHRHGDKERGKHSRNGNGHSYDNENPFENNTSLNITVPLGDTAFLRCRVHNLGERSVSWIRRRDYHILTTGMATYTNDERFHVIHSEDSDDWVLQIKFVQKRDNGTYECQVSTGTGVGSFVINLFIAVPEAFILGNGDYHVEQGSTINLVCIIEKSPKPPEYIFWYHNQRMINYGISRELTEVHTEPGSGKTHSRLIIRKAHKAHSGNYTCKAANADPASILVFVTEASGLFTGDQTAAIHHKKVTTSSATSLILNVSNSLVPSALYHYHLQLPSLSLWILPLLLVHFKSL